MWGSLVKQTMRRVHPGFTESPWGYRNFNGLLEAAAMAGLLKLEKDEARGNYMVRSAEE